MKKIHKKILPMLCVLGVFFTVGRADTEISNPTFMIFHEFGRFEKGLSENVLEVEAQWVHRSAGWVGYKASSGEHLTAEISLGGVYWIPTRVDSDKGSRIRRLAPSISKLSLDYYFGDREEPKFTLKGGVFLYKYNKDVKNLGEYLFRSNAYPGFLQTGGLHYVASNKVQLNGLHFNQKFGDIFEHDILFTLESSTIPLGDLNFSYIAKLKLGEAITLGGGFQWARMIPANPSVTNPEPESYQNQYFQLNGQSYVGKSDYYNAQADYYIAKIAELDTLIANSEGGATPAQTDLRAEYSSRAMAMEETADLVDSLIFTKDPATNWKPFTAQAFKPLAFFNVDPKALFSMDALGAEDLKLYGEIIVLGIKDQPVFYSDISERIAWMIGFNIPTFKLLDYLALEVEKYTTKFPNSISIGHNGFLPIPAIPAGSEGYHPDLWAEDDWKWSISAKRSVGENLSILGQAARDNARGFEYPAGQTDWALFTKKDHWYWAVKLMVNM